MSYSIKNGSFVSHLTGRAYAFERTPDGSAKRAALAKLTADEKAFRDAKAARPDTPPAKPTRADKLAAVVHLPREETNVADSIGSRIATLERRLQHTRAEGDRASIQRKINALAARQDTESAKQEQQAARQSFLDSAEWAEASRDAFEIAEQLALRADPDLPESLVRDAFENREQLRRNPTPNGITEYREREAVLREAHRAGKIKSIEISKARIAHAETAIRLAVLDPSPQLPSEQMGATDENDN